MADKKKPTRRRVIGKDTQGSNNIPFAVTKDNPFVIAKLVEVVVGESEEKKNPYLLFHFTDKKGKQTYFHYENFNNEPIEKKSGGEISVEELNETQDRRIAHIFNTFMGTEAHSRVNEGEGLGADADQTIEDDKEFAKAFFEAIANSFNTARAGGPVFNDAKGNPIYVWMRLVYNGGRLGFPLYPNFLDVFEQGRPTYLRTGKSDVLTPPSKGGNRSEITVDNADEPADSGLPPGFA